MRNIRADRIKPGATLANGHLSPLHVESTSIPLGNFTPRVDTADLEWSMFAHCWLKVDRKGNVVAAWDEELRPIDLQPHDDDDDDAMMPCERCRSLAHELTKRGKLWVCERCDPLHDSGGE